MRVSLAVFLLFLSLPSAAVTVGSKAFTEGYLLGELLAQTLERTTELPINRRFGMGGTGILFEALRAGDVDLYPEYTGTISEAILKDPSITSWEGLNKRLEELGLVISKPLGFNNTYAVAVTQAFAQKKNLRTISDLRKIAAELRAGFSHEFMSRSDGFPALRSRYRLDFAGEPQSMEHSLAYEAIARGAVDVIDAYSTDAKIEKLQLQVLEDDLKFFPEYQAVILARLEFVQAHPAAWRALQELEGSLGEAAMIRMNAEADLKRKSFTAVISEYFSDGPQVLNPLAERISSRVFRRTQEHLVLVGIALVFSVLVGIPLGILADRKRWLGQGVLLFSGAVQTIPSLALLCFLIPLFGIGMKPAIVALCLYGLLPVVVNTFVGLRSIDPRLKEMAEVLGLNGWQRLHRIELPLAMRSILAGVKTSMVISIGTATLAALIGAGGYGAPIVMGLAINDMRTILIGAVPASVMAILAHIFFDAGTRFLVPRALR